MRVWTANRPETAFYLLTLTLSWGYWLTLLAKGLRVAPDSIAHFPGLLGPMLAAIVVTAVTGGRKALRELFARMVWLGPRWISKLMLALSPLVLGAVALTILPLLGKPLPAVGAFAQVPGMPDGWPLAWVLAAVIVVNGFGEETGWRGFLTERLLRTQGKLGELHHLSRRLFFPDTKRWIRLREYKAMRVRLAESGVRTISRPRSYVVDSSSRGQDV
jgi:membrane protease YdiL (CAAX protease family)